MISRLRSHPDAVVLADFVQHAEKSPSTVRAHVMSCAACRRTVAEISRIRESQQTLHGRAVPHTGLRDRILASRASGTRTIVPVPSATPSQRRWLGAAAAVAATMLVVVTVFVAARDVQASDVSGSLKIAPSGVQPGKQFKVMYDPAAYFEDDSVLVLRARVRTGWSESYSSNANTIVAARMRRSANGTFTANVQFGDSVVLAVLAVENEGATRVDDHGQRGWELVTVGANGTPLLEALDQRHADWMGRSWEEGYKTAQQIVHLYPDSIRAWSLLRTYEGWMNLTSDSTLAVHAKQIRRFDAKLRSQPNPDANDLGMMMWYAGREDTATYAYWRERLLREAPNQSFAVQERLLAILDTLRKQADTSAALSSLDALYRNAPRERRAQVASYSTSIAVALRDSSRIALWMGRVMESASDPSSAAQYNALQLSRSPATREEGIRRVRAMLVTFDTVSDTRRRLFETRAAYLRRLDGERRTLLSQHGQLLLADKLYRAALDTLQLAAASGWNTEIIRAVQRATLAAGDTAGYLRNTARLTVDPAGTSWLPGSTRRDSLEAIGIRLAGAARWNVLVDSGRREFVQAMLANASSRPIRSGLTVQNLEGERIELDRRLGNGQLAVVVFWSRFCGPAVEAIEGFNATAGVLLQQGVRIVNVVEETKVSPALIDFLREKKVLGEVYLDNAGKAGTAFNSWGTPAFFVVDGVGQVRFSATSSVQSVVSRIAALQASSELQAGVGSR